MFDRIVDLYKDLVYLCGVRFEVRFVPERRLGLRLAVGCAVVIPTIDCDCPIDTRAPFKALYLAEIKA